MKLLFALIASASALLAQSPSLSVTTINLSALPGPDSAFYAGPPVVLVMINDASTDIDHYTVTLPYIDPQGAMQFREQNCPANRTSPNTICVFDVAAASVSQAFAIAVPFSRPLAVRKR